ncbi:hypothetical protein JMJ77_0000824 [Colletotrichum scovillei]|uniref:Uncharacterized protein n=2 Tax=Colletotrichum acutatum species complex TaxID=2707335 RepID=A0A9P7RC00_9PEZI|nr:hypothetical protein JMJ77_0000824 [Colletotrichum scovillei]KAG7072037.1 hypothetical protein JMJ76_0004899 [Colletotrichum scovillei]KAG7080215.1 hypothetical protein JMJ78_0007315 [Colletotrichum scovillei]KXH28444.1 hypothetical protein CNYM01_12911 [Colletotrichum nymphaeae SA-01]
MKLSSSLFFIAQMAGTAFALSGDGAKCQLNIDCLSGYCMPHTGSSEYVCWGQRRKGDWCNVNYTGTVCNNGLKCVSYQGSWFLGKCT